MSLPRKKSDSEKIRFLTRGGHVTFHGTRYSRICPYCRRIRVRIVGFPGHDTSFFTQCLELRSRCQNKNTKFETDDQFNTYSKSQFQVTGIGSIRATIVGLLSSVSFSCYGRLSINKCISVAAISASVKLVRGIICQEPFYISFLYQ